MAKGSTNRNYGKKTEILNSMPKKEKHSHHNDDYLFRMSMAPTLGESTHWFQMLPVAFFTAVVIMIVRMTTYERPMDQFFWGGASQINDFFSYYKMEAILLCAVLVVVLLLYRVFTQSFFIKRSFAYIPMIIYMAFVLLSYFLSDYKLFALWGWNDRFEGTLTLLAYMVMLFFIINSVNSEKNVKWIVYSLAIASSILGLLGLSQALDHDFFRTTVGKKLITPSWFWDQVDSLNFTFQNKEIYQTVYNINYVSFYLTLLIPLFGMLFIRSIIKGKEEAIWKKIVWGLVLSLLVFNLIGSASSGGLMGMAVAVLIGIIVLNKKLIEWWKPVLILLVLTILIAGVSYERWMPELTGAIKGVLGAQSEQTDIAKQSQAEESEVANNAESAFKVDYIVTSGQAIIMSISGNEMTFFTYPDDPSAIKVKDSQDKSIPLEETNIPSIYFANDERFDRITLRPAQDDAGNNYFVIGTNGDEWPFLLTPEGPKYRTNLGKAVDLHKVPAVGWEKNQPFGSGRGYIWSRTIPIMKETILLGHGADTYCIYFPQEDFVGKYNSGTFSSNINIIVDKPHNMYFGAIVGTGGISMLALLALWGIYVVQSFLIYRKQRYDSFITYVGVGIFLGICGFLVAGFVNDSTVSVMPMFYGLLGTGISINSMIKKETGKVIE